MRTSSIIVAGAALVGRAAAVPCSSVYPTSSTTSSSPSAPTAKVDLGPRPYFIVDAMDEGPLKDELKSCADMEMHTSDWSIGHRGGGTLMMPEHSAQSAFAGARMGAGILECDVAFTSDLELVCRHSQCDLHTTTNIVAIPELNAKCTTPFTPAANGQPATARCCTSDITVAEFKTLCAKMDASDPTATTPEDFLGGTADWRTDLYATCGTVLTHKEHIALVDELGLKYTPELKFPEVEMPFRGNYTQQNYAQQLIDEYKEAGISADRVWPQSFNYPDVIYWVENEPEFGEQAVWLDETADSLETMPAAIAFLDQLVEDGVKIVAPPLPYLVVSDNGTIVPSPYAERANELGLDIISWSLERSPPLAQVHENGDYYYFTVQDAVHNDGDIYTLVDVLYRQVGIIGLFSDWSATATYYINCVTRNA
jgi:glycerophosphoryl diester phosphodiesterase